MIRAIDFLVFGNHLDSCKWRTPKWNLKNDSFYICSFPLQRIPVNQLLIYGIFLNLLLLEILQEIQFPLVFIFLVLSSCFQVYFLCIHLYIQWNNSIIERCGGFYKHCYGINTNTHYFIEHGNMLLLSIPYQQRGIINSGLLCFILIRTAKHSPIIINF